MDVPSGQASEPGMADVNTGPCHLSPREREVLRHVADGRTYRQIASALEITTHTVDTHLRRIRRKTGALTLADLVRFALSLDGIRA